MKTLRLIGMALIAVIMCVNFVACSDDDDEETNATIEVLGNILQALMKICVQALSLSKVMAA